MEIVKVNRNEMIGALLTIVLTCLCQPLKAQVPQTDWAISMGSTTSDYARKLAIDQSGNIYCAGTFTGTADFNPTSAISNLPSNGEEDIFVHKSDASGNLIWAKAIGNDEEDYVSAIALSPNGDVYVLGYFQETLDADPGAGVTNLVAVGNKDVFIIKLDLNGNFLWARSYGGVGVDEGESIDIDDAGDVYVSGSFAYTVDLDPGPAINNFTVIAQRDIFIQKFSATGDLIWAKAFGGPSTEITSDLELDNAGCIYITGNFNSSVDFDPGPGTSTLNASTMDIFVQKLSSSGDFIWARCVLSDHEIYPRSIALDTAANIYITGDFEGLLTDFDPGAGEFLLSSYFTTPDIFVMKLDSTSAFQWAKSIGNEAGQYSHSIEAGHDGVYLCGMFWEMVDFDPGPGTFDLGAPGSYGECFVQKLDMDGNLLWVQQYGAGSTDAAFDLALDPSGDVIACGSFQHTTDFDPGPGSMSRASKGMSDAFVLRLKQCENSGSTMVVSACQEYTWIDGITYTASINTGHTLSNSQGCDSVVILDLTIHELDNAVTVFSTGAYANSTTASCQWLDCNNGFAPIAGATDQLFLPDTNGSYAVELLENGCIDTSACVNISGITNLGIASIEALTMSVAPNPFSHSTILFFGQELTQPLRVSIYDLMSRQVFSIANITGSQAEIQPRSLEAGTYILQVTDQETNAIIYIAKVIIE